MELYDQHGQRKYLTVSEWDAFLRAADTAAPRVRTFCKTLAYSGCRISEALALTSDRADLSDGMLVIESLKKRRRGVYRAVPVPPAFLESLAATHNLPSADRDRLWTFSRVTGYRRIREVMNAAGISGKHASARGIRHGFAVNCVLSGVPLTMIQKWMGHSDIATSAIYTNVAGPEERQIARLTWR